MDLEKSASSNAGIGEEDMQKITRLLQLGKKCRGTYAGYDTIPRLVNIVGLGESIRGQVRCRLRGAPPSDRTMACRLQPRYSFQYSILSCSALRWLQCLKIGFLSGFLRTPSDVSTVVSRSDATGICISQRCLVLFGDSGCFVPLEIRMGENHSRLPSRPSLA